MTEAKYSVRAYCRDTDGGYDEESSADTIKEATSRAKEMMTDEHMRVVESTVPVVYVEIVDVKSGEIIRDFGHRCCALNSHRR